LHSDRTWYILAYINNYQEDVEPGVEDIILFTVIDPETTSEYIPVFDSSDMCNEYINDLSAEGKRDKSICIYGFQTLSDIEKRVRADFGRPVQLIVTATDEQQSEDEEADE